MQLSKGSAAQRSFAVDNVEVATERLETQELKFTLGDRLARRIYLVCDPAKATLMYGGRSNSFINSVHLAFSSHYPLAISPDDIWLVIAQGFSHHVTENAERLRSRLVTHEGKKELVQHMDRLDLEGFRGCIAGLSAQIRGHSDPVLHETLVCDFSTTTPDVRTASEIVLMDTYSSYFEYRAGCICGIPRVTLTGTVEDWERIQARIEVLATYELEWWIDRVRPILNEFVQSAKGYPNREFWQAIYKPKHFYATTTATGWITEMFPYLGDTRPRVRSHIFDRPACEWKSIKETRDAVRDGLDTSSIPSGLASVPLKILAAPESVSTELVGGFLGIQQSADLCVAPVIGWCVTSPKPKQSHQRQSATNMLNSYGDFAP